MVIKHNQAVSTSIRKEFRCLGKHSEWFLYETRLNCGAWTLITRPAGVVTNLGDFSTNELAYKAAYQHANN
jgi:hypothetical protein